MRCPGANRGTGRSSVARHCALCCGGRPAVPVAMCPVTITFGVVIVSVHAAKSPDQFIADAVAENMAALNAPEQVEWATGHGKRPGTIRKVDSGALAERPLRSERFAMVTGRYWAGNCR